MLVIAKIQEFRILQILSWPEIWLMVFQLIVVFYNFFSSFINWSAQQEAWDLLLCIGPLHI